MTPKTFIGLAVVTVAVTAAAVYSAQQHYSVARTERSEQVLFPELADQLNEVSFLTVRSADATINMAREEGGWVLAEQWGYPARSEAVRQALVGLAELRAVEPKTRMPERHARLEVQDVTAAGAQSRMLTLKDIDGDLLAEVVVGRKRFDMGGTGGEGIYVRRADEDQVWLARGQFPYNKSVRDWLDRDVTDVDEDRVRRITTVDAEGNELVVVRDAPGDEHFRIDNLPDGFALKDGWQREVDRMGGALSGLLLDSVVPADEKELAETGAVTAEVETFDGLVVRLVMTPEGEGDDATWWTAVTATLSPGADPQPAAEADSDPEAGIEAGTESGTDSEADSPLLSPDQVQAESIAISERVAGWLYQLAEYQVGALRTRLGDLEKKPDDESS